MSGVLQLRQQVSTASTRYYCVPVNGQIRALCNVPSIFRVDIVGCPQTGGVLRRGGHTEAAVDLAKLAGLSPVGVLCEITTKDGKGMAR